VEASQDSLAAEVFKALGDPVRWSIITQIGAVDELPCAELEQTLPVSKPTISYHTKILQQAGLLTVRKQGRNYFYALRRDVLADVQEALWRLAAVPAAPAAGTAGAERTTDGRRERPLARAAGDDETVLLTW
jgi:DNA-binding transcriptional ArsR family regulator